MSNLLSYSSSNSFPVKLIGDLSLMRQISDGHIEPRHLTANITNHCDKNCSFCYSRDRDLSVSCSACELLDRFHVWNQLGTVAVTISGGGEPTLHPEINDIIVQCPIRYIGLTTNTSGVHRLSGEAVHRLTFCRISTSDAYPVPIGDIEKAACLLEGVDLGISYVCTDPTDLSYLLSCMRFLEHTQFTHLRIVTDRVSKVAIDLGKIKRELSSASDKVIYQDGLVFGVGDRCCLVSLLRPCMDVDGRIYPCCSVMYNSSKFDTHRTYNVEQSMGEMKEAKTIWEQQLWYDGSKCNCCYYGDYNKVLNSVASFDSVQHKSFV